MVLDTPSPHPSEKCWKILGCMSQKLQLIHRYGSRQIQQEVEQRCSLIWSQVMTYDEKKIWRRKSTTHVQAPDFPKQGKSFLQFLLLAAFGYLICRHRRRTEFVMQWKPFTCLQGDSYFHFSTEEFEKTTQRKLVDCWTTILCFKCKGRHFGKEVFIIIVHFEFETRLI